MPRKKYSHNRSKGMGGPVPTYKLSDSSKNKILDLIKKKRINDMEGFIEIIERGVRDFMFSSKMNDELPQENLYEELSLINKASTELLYHMSNCNLQVFSMINIGYYEATGKYSFPDEAFQEMLEDFVRASENIINSKRKVRGDKHTSIQHVTRSVMLALKKHTDYKISHKENMKMVQIIKILQDEISYHGDAPSFVKSFLNSLPQDS